MKQVNWGDSNEETIYKYMDKIGINLQGGTATYGSSSVWHNYP